MILFSYTPNRNISLNFLLNSKIELNLGFFTSSYFNVFCKFLMNFRFLNVVSPIFQLRFFHWNSFTCHLHPGFNFTTLIKMFRFPIFTSLSVWPFVCFFCFYYISCFLSFAVWLSFFAFVVCFVSFIFNIFVCLSISLHFCFISRLLVCPTVYCLYLSLDFFGFSVFFSFIINFSNVSFCIRLIFVGKVWFFILLPLFWCQFCINIFNTILKPYGKKVIL